MSSVASSMQDVLEKFLDERLKYFRQKCFLHTIFQTHWIWIMIQFYYEQK